MAASILRRLAAGSLDKTASLTVWDAPCRCPGASRRLTELVSSGKDQEEGLPSRIFSCSHLLLAQPACPFARALCAPTRLSAARSLI